VRSAYKQFRLLEQTEPVCPGRDPRPQWTRPTQEYIHCHCGKCKSCLDNAQWDRIFNQKFADPNYYASRTISHGSSLGWLKK
jgi:hypothetical protein